MSCATLATPQDSLPQRVITQSGLHVAEIGIGCWAIGGPDWNLGLPMGWGGVDDEKSIDALERAYALGANHFDTADVYGHGHSERLLGRLVRRVPRDCLVLGSKVGYFRGTAPSAYHPLHLRHQLEMSLSNLGTDHVDIYYFHNFDFGTGFAYLDDAVEQMRRFRDEGKIRVIGMRGPHRFAPDRVRGVQGRDKRSLFLEVADRVLPDVIQVRFNLLTPPAHGLDIFAWAEKRGVGVVINKPLAQGLLLDKYDPAAPPSFELGDHRRRKRWFTPAGLSALHRRLAVVREHFGPGPGELVRAALQYCLHDRPHACVLVGCKNPEQVEMNLQAAGRPLSNDDFRVLREAMAGINEELGAFFHEKEGEECTSPRIS